MDKVTNHIQHYLPLVGIFISGIIGFSLFSYDQLFQMIVVVAVGISYVVWGVVHHIIHKDLHLSVFIEYLTISILGVTIVFTLLFRV